jgi:hypothetical protein
MVLDENPEGFNANPSNPDSPLLSQDHCQLYYYRSFLSELYYQKRNLPYSHNVSASAPLMLGVAPSLRTPLLPTVVQTFVQSGAEDRCQRESQVAISRKNPQQILPIVLHMS